MKRVAEALERTQGEALAAMTRKSAVWVLAVLTGLFALRMSLNVGATLRGWDESHVCAAAARLVEVGGPLYGNALVTKGPVVFWFTAGVFRLAGLYSMPAWRLAAVAWWVATAFTIYASARTMVGRPASLAAATAFLLSAMNPGFQAIRGEVLVCLPLAAAVGLCVRGVERREGTSLALAGAACGVAFLTKQNAGLALPVLAAWPLLVWWWRRGRGELWRAVAGLALVLGGFAAVLAATWFYYSARGAGHELFYCVWSYNWAFLRHKTPAGGFLPSAFFFWSRVARYVMTEPFLAVAIVGAVVGLGRRGEPTASPGGVPWRAKVLLLALLLGVMWLAGSPAGVPEWSLLGYVYYAIVLYVPMCLLVGVCVEVASRPDGGRRALLMAGAGLAIALVVIPAARPFDSVPFRLGTYVRMLGVWQLLGSAAVFGAAAWLLGGGRVAAIALATWVALYLSSPRLLSWEGSHLAASGAMVALGVLWQASRHKSLALALLAGVLQVAGFWLDLSPQVGFGVGAALWLLWSTDAPWQDRVAMACAYLAPVAITGVGMVYHWGTGPWALAASRWYTMVVGWLMHWRLAGTLAVCACVLLVWSAGHWREGWRRVIGHPLGLVLFGGIGALAAGAVPRLSAYFLTTAGTAAALACALALGMLTRSQGPAPGVRASVLLASACAISCLAAVAIGSKAPKAYATPVGRVGLVQAIEPGSRAFVWGTISGTELYVRARAVPAVPQVYTWMLEGIGPPPLGAGWYGYPEAATLEGLGRALCDALPDAVAIVGEEEIRLEDLPRFGPILRSRYRVAERTPDGRVYRLIAQ